MTPDIDHDRCSELLSGYARGELPAAEAQQVERHLAGCRLCASEHGALSVLQGPEPPGLAETERARMRRTVLAEAVRARDSAAAQRDAADDRRARLFPLLGAAALIAGLAVFAYTGSGGLGGSDDAAQAPAGVEDEAGGAGGDGAGEDRDRSNEALMEQDGAADTGATRSNVASAGRAAPPGPTFKASIGEVGRKELNRLGRRGLPLVLFSRAFQVRDVERLRDRFVDELADAAPEARGAQIRECVAPITTNFPSALPAYSAIADYTDRPRREVLIVAFTWTTEPEGPLDQSMVWAWPLDTCNQVAHYSKNLIQPRR